MESLSLKEKTHRHNYNQEGNFLVCSCGKKILKLEQEGKEGMLIGKRSNGSGYSVRTDRRRYFFPQEWINFIKQITNKEHRFFFLTCLHTGGRIMEVLNLRYKDIDLDREVVTFSVVKQRKAKKNFATGKSRSFFLASNFIREYKTLIRTKIISPELVNSENYIFLNNEKLPKNYNELDNSERKKYYTSKVVSYSRILKGRAKKSGIKDWHNFSPHNLRKTYGMWMRTFNKEMSELCYRMGHDMDTYLAHYGSSLIFTESDRRLIQQIMGDVK